MSCGCENKKLGGELDRVRRLAKAFASIEQKTVAIVDNGDGTYDFYALNDVFNKPIIEYVSEY